MKRAVVLLLLTLASCKREPVIQAIIQVAPELRASCIVLRVMSNGGMELAKRSFVRQEQGPDLHVAIYQGELPRDVRLQAEALWKGPCEQESPLSNGHSEFADAHFEPGAPPTLTLSLPRPSDDLDGDGFVSDAAGGPDCDDSRMQRHPGVQELCTSDTDLNCDGKRGCDDDLCKSEACLDVRDTLVFTRLPLNALAGQCSEAVTLERRDYKGEPSVTSASTPLTLTSTFPSSVTLYSDIDCQQPLSSPTLPSGGGPLTFYVKGTMAGDGELTAMVSGLLSATQAHHILPGPPAQLSFLSAAGTPLAGACSPVTVGWLDEFSNPTTSQLSALSLSPVPGTPEEAALYQDKDCTQPLSLVSLPASTSASFYFRGTRAGSLDIVATSGARPLQARQTQTVKPDKATRFQIASPASTKLAGECSGPVAMRILDRYDNLAPLASGATLSVGAAPDPGFSLYADSSCTYGLPRTFPTLNYTQGNFYYKAKTGGPLDITLASAGLASATQTQTVIPVVRRDTCALPNGTLEKTCPLSPPLGDVNRSFLVFQATTNNGDSGSTYVRCRLTSPSAITCTRVQGQGSAAIQWQVVELSRGLTVQHLDIACPYGSDVFLATVNAVKDLKSAFVLFSSSQGGTRADSDDFFTVRLSAANKVEIDMGGYCNNNIFSVQVVQLDGSQVERNFTGAMTNPTLEVGGLPAADLTRTVVLSSYRSDSTSSAICNRMVRAEIPTATPTAVRFSRGAGSSNNACYSNDLYKIAWERIAFPAGTLVQTVGLTATGTTTATATLATAVDSTRTLLLSSSQVHSGQSSGETDFLTDDIMGVGTGRLTLASPTQLKVERDSNQGTARWTSYAVQFDP